MWRGGAGWGTWRAIGRGCLVDLVVVAEEVVGSPTVGEVGGGPVAAVVAIGLRCGLRVEWLAWILAVGCHGCFSRCVRPLNM